MQIHFTKMHALGNDFVIIDETLSTSGARISPSIARDIAHRHHGVGCDQVLVMQPSTCADVAMRIYNADGSVAAACGNGARCVAWLWMTRCNRQSVLIEVGDRVLQAWQNPQSGRCDGCSDVDVRIDMGIPQFDISIDMGGPQFDLSYTQTLRQYIPATFVSIGNPHVVVVCSSENSLCSSENHPTVPSPYDKPPHDNATHGKPIHDEKHDFESPAHILSLANEKFPDGINIEWMRVFDAHNIAIKIYERGVGETFACGTGACAAAVVAISEGYCEPNVAVHMAHGAVQVSYNESIVLTGCVSFVFEGKIDYNAR